MQKRKTLFVIIALLILFISVILSLFIPDYSNQIKAMGVLATCLIMWLSEAMPISISSLLMISLLPFIGLMDFKDVLANFGINTSLFIMASSAITVALSSSAVPQYITSIVFNKGGEHPALLVILLSLAVAIFSAFVSSLATCALFTSIIVTALKSANIKPHETNLGKDLMLVIPACAGIGGFMTPAGTPANILVMDMLNERGSSITFLKWCAIGFPIGIVAVLIFSLSVVLVFKPEDNIVISKNEHITFTYKDKLVIAIVLLVILGWVVGSFIPILTTTVVSLIGLAIMFVPAFGLLNMDSFSKGVNWDLVISMGTVSILMTAIANTGLLDRVTSSIFANVSGMPIYLMLIVISFVICIMRSFIPTTTAVIMLFAPMLISISETMGLAIVPLLLLVSFWAASALLLVYTEPIYLITYKEGYFSETDLLKTGIVPSVLLSVIATLGIYLLSLIID